MHIPRIYQEISLASGTCVPLSTDASHHLSRVLRKTTGAAIILFNGQGGEYQAELEVSHKNLCYAHIKAFDSYNRESPLTLHLGQALVSNEKMDLIVQKAVELGVNTITPILTQHSQVRIDAVRLQKRLAHWRAICINACEQSQRQLIPTLNPPVALSDWLRETRVGLSLVLHPDRDALPTKLPARPAQLTLLIGPEGGLHDEEVAAAKAANFHCVHLGPRILRAETASIAALGIVQHRFGDMDFDFTSA